MVRVLLSLLLVVAFLIYQCGGEEETTPSSDQGETTTSTSSSTTSSSSGTSGTSSSSSTSPSSSSSSSSSPCDSIDWNTMGKVEVYINVVDPNNAYLCSRNGGTGTIEATSNGATITYTPVSADLTGTLGWSGTYTGGTFCKIWSTQDNLVTFEVEVPPTTSTISVATCYWNVSGVNDNTLVRSSTNNFDIGDISDDGNCDSCSGSYYDLDSTISVNSGKAYFIISGYCTTSTCSNAWVVGDNTPFSISW